MSPRYPNSDVAQVPELDITTPKSQLLSDLVCPGQGLAALLQVIGGRVDIGPLGETGVIVACPLAHDGDRDACVLHECQRRMPGVVQGDAAQTDPLEQPSELVGVPLWMDGHSQLVSDHILTALVPIQFGSPAR